MKFYYFNFFILFILISSRIVALGDSLLVRIGASGISLEEFQQRFELIPQIAQAGKNIEQKRITCFILLLRKTLGA